MQHSRRILFATFTILLAAQASLARPPATLQADVAKILNRPSLRCAHVGIIIMSLPDGEVWYSSNPDRLFLPASNVKLFVAAAALDQLTPQFRYQTHVRWAPSPQDGVLRGDIFIKGYGDPALLFTHIAALAESVRDSGISHITGRVVADDTAFDSVRYGAGWMLEDLPWYYAAEISALSLNGNSLQVIVRPGPAAHRPAVVTVSPPTTYMDIQADVTTCPTGSYIGINVERPLGTRIVKVRGSTVPGARPVVERLSVPDPALWAAHVFTERLRACGVQVDGEPALGRELALGEIRLRHHSPPLKEIVATMLKHSDNLMAEQLLKTLGAQTTGNGTVEDGLAVVNRFLRKAGVASACVPHLADGSGLSRYNLASPRHIASLLRFMDRQPHRSAWLNALPVAGVSGTLEGRMTDSPAAGIARAKTGTMFAVSALSGYASTRNGRRVCFSILVNNFVAPTREIRQAQDDIVAAIARAR